MEFGCCRKFEFFSIEIHRKELRESEFTLEEIQETLKRKIEQTDVENLHIIQEKYKILKVVQEIAGKELPSESSKEYTIRLSKIGDIVHF